MTGESPPPKKKRRRWLRWLLLILVVFGTGIFFLSRDEELKPADDLMPQQLTEVAWDDNNGWKRLHDFAGKIKPLDGGTQYPKLSRIIMLQQEADPAEWKAVALSDAELTELEAIAAMPVFQDVQYDSVAAIMEADLTKATAVARRLQATAVSAMEEKQAALVLRCLRLADRMAGKQMAGATCGQGLMVGHGSLHDDLVALALVRVEFSDADLNELAAILDGDSITVEQRLAVLRQDFRLMRNEIQRITDFSELGISGGDWLTELYFQRNRTLNLLAGFYRDTMPLTLTAPWPEIEKLQLKRKNPGDWTSWLEPNRSGMLWVHYSLNPASLEVFWRYSNSTRRCMQAITALHRFQKARGALPAKLDELVPDFLTAVPAGAFHFEPLRWDAKSRSVRCLERSGHLGPPTTAPPNVLIYSRSEGTAAVFRTKAEEDARRAAKPAPKTPWPKSKKPAAPAPSGSTGP